MRTLAKSSCVSWPSVNARAGQILCVPTLDKYKKQSIYFSYKYIDDYVEKLYEHYCYIHEDSFEKNELEIISNVGTYELYDQVQLGIFQQGTLF